MAGAVSQPDSYLWQLSHDVKFGDCIYPKGFVFFSRDNPPTQFATEQYGEPKIRADNLNYVPSTHPTCDGCGTLVSNPFLDAEVNCPQCEAIVSMEAYVCRFPGCSFTTRNQTEAEEHLHPKKNSEPVCYVVTNVIAPCHIITSQPITIRSPVVPRVAQPAVAPEPPSLDLQDIHDEVARVQKLLNARLAFVRDQMQSLARAREELERAREAQAAQLQHRRDELERIHAQDVRRLQREREEFLRVSGELAKFKDPIKLNVGGTVYSTSQTTLGARDSMLRAMFSGRHTLEIGADGSYFIDRDPKHFGKILNYLRDGELVLTGDAAERREVLKEAKYYCLADLVEALEPPLQFAFDPTRTVNDAVLADSARVLSCSSAHWADALLKPAVSSGVQSCHLRFVAGQNVMIGVAPAGVEITKKGLHATGKCYLFHSQGSFISAGTAGARDNWGGYEPGTVVTVTLDMDAHTVTFTAGTRQYSAEVQGTSLCFAVSVHQSSVALA